MSQNVYSCFKNSIYYVDVWHHIVKREPFDEASTAESELTTLKKQASEPGQSIVSLPSKVGTDSLVCLTNAYTQVADYHGTAISHFQRQQLVPMPPREHMTQNGIVSVLWFARTSLRSSTRQRVSEDHARRPRGGSSAPHLSRCLKKFH